MTGSLHLQRKMHQTLCQYLPKLSRPQRGNLSWTIAGLHKAQHVHLSKIASKRVGSAQLESKTKQLRRFMANDQVDPQRCYEPVASLLLEAAASSGKPIRLLVDTLELSGQRQVLMAALAYRRRALPVYWQVRRRTGVTDAQQQISLLEALSGWIPQSRKTVIIGDGAFHSTDLMAYISGQGWHFRLRLHADTYIRLSGGDWRQLGELAPQKGERCYLESVYLTKGDPYGPVRVAICHEESEDDPWFIATDEQADYLTLRTYSRRMWIEELFGDLEGGGFQLQSSRLYQVDRLSRLVMALCWTYVWLMHVGVWVVKRGFRKFVGRTDRRDLSYAEIGRRYTQRCMTNGKPLHIGLKPYF